MRNFPLLGRVRYISEHVGPELRQHLFSEDDEGEPFSRLEFQSVVKSGKYNQRLVGFGSDKDFEEEGYFIRNNMFPKLLTEMRVDNMDEHWRRWHIRPSSGR